MGHFHWLAGGSWVIGSQGFQASIFLERISSFSAWTMSSSTWPQLILASNVFKSDSCNNRSWLRNTLYFYDRQTVTSLTAAARSLIICSVYRR